MGPQRSEKFSVKLMHHLSAVIVTEWYRCDLNSNDAPTLYQFVQRTYKYKCIWQGHTASEMQVEKACWIHFFLKRSTRSVCRFRSSVNELTMRDFSVRSNGFILSHEMYPSCTGIYPWIHSQFFDFDSRRSPALDHPGRVEQSSTNDDINLKDLATGEVILSNTKNLQLDLLVLILGCVNEKPLELIQIEECKHSTGVAHRLQQGLNEDPFHNELGSSRCILNVRFRFCLRQCSALKPG
eukprot:TRINITY_DN5266_c0_g1_i1.p1 TRINITY_DN5266_c0_g1~~TRINITY_DN5266_c0_g1_i1.p1  ORF type:complete len:239 (+),score=-16.08 TRINITY_DN5266_c0_g1_i1:307-1023(+)